MSGGTPLGRALGMGSAKDGAGHWWAQRVSAIAIIPLGLWFIVGITRLIGSRHTDYLSVVDWVANPVNAVALILLIATMCYHSALGVQVVIEDYVHGWAKVAALILQKFAHAIAAAAGIFSVLQIAFAV